MVGESERTAGRLRPQELLRRRHRGVSNIDVKVKAASCTLGLSASSPPRPARRLPWPGAASSQSLQL